MKLFGIRFEKRCKKQTDKQYSKRFKIILLVLFMGFFLFPANNVWASPAQDQLKASIDQVLEILRDESLKGEEFAEKRRESIRKLIYERFSFSKMSQLSLAKHWKERTEEEKKIFIKLFGQLLEEAYVSKVESYSGEEVIFIKEYVKDNKAQINTKIISDSIEIPMNYRMYEIKEGSWMVYDVVIEGVSLVGNYRSQFDNFLKKESFEKLVEEIQKKIES